LEYCSESEQKELEEEFGLSVTQQEDGQMVKVQFEATRGSDYFTYLRNDQLDIPQLYLCSKNDALCDFEKVLDLVAHRQSQQISPIKVQFWKESQHCGHLKRHPRSYKEAVDYFIKLGFHRARL